MNIFLMVLTCLNIILVLGLSFTVFLRVKEKKEDQRITKGLQLLQHKIAILQDLSDKADEQVQRLVHMLDTKSNELRRTTQEACTAMNSIQARTSELRSNLNSEVGAANPVTTPNMTPQVSTTTQFNLDEFSQFVQALNIQNEKIKPVQVLAPRENVPQDFEFSPKEMVEAQNPVEMNIRPFEFRRVYKA